MRKRGAAFRTVKAMAAPYGAGARVDTVPKEMDLKDLTHDIAPGGILIFRVDLQQPADVKRIRVLVRFGDGRRVRARPRSSDLSLTASTANTGDPAPIGASPGSARESHSREGGGPDMGEHAEGGSAEDGH